MNPKLFVIVMFSAMLITIGVGNMLTAPAASPTVCDGDCATCPNVTAVACGESSLGYTTCPENPQYSEPAESCDDGACRAPLRKAGKAVIKAPIKTVGGAGRIATKPFKVFRIFRRR